MSDNSESENEVIDLGEEDSGEEESNDSNDDSGDDSDGAGPTMKDLYEGKVVSTNPTEYLSCRFLVAGFNHFTILVF